MFASDAAVTCTFSFILLVRIFHFLSPFFTFFRQTYFYSFVKKHNKFWSRRNFANFSVLYINSGYKKVSVCRVPHSDVRLVFLHSLHRVKSTSVKL